MGWEPELKQKKSVQKELFKALSPEQNGIVTLLKKHKQLTIDQICTRSKLPVSKISPLLLDLEFSGIVQSLPGQVYALTD